MSNAPTLTRENYKAIKHMDKAAMTAYLYRVYMRGVERGRAVGWADRAPVHRSGNGCAGAAANHAC